MTNTKAMDFEATPFKLGNAKTMKNKVSDDVLAKISTSRIIWHLVKRHKFGLVSVWAILVTLTWAFPPIWDLLGSLISK